MIPIRRSPDKTSNKLLKEARSSKGESNIKWLTRVKESEGIVLIGGSSVTDFRIRVAQSHLRSDLLPSFWSIVGILRNRNRFVTVPLTSQFDPSITPKNNGIVESSMKVYDNPEVFPNIAVIHFTNDYSKVYGNIEAVKSQRAIIDIPNLILPWLGFIWAAGNFGNPLLSENGLPSAALVETVFGISGIGLTPGLSSSSSCPEAIWQSAKWWREFYKESTKSDSRKGVPGIVPTGHYTIRQLAAAVVE